MASHLSAVELLKLGDEGRKKPWANYYWPELVGSFLGLCTGCFLNYQTRRPAFSGIQKHVAITAGFIVALKAVYKRREEYFAERDAVFRHYIELHPEEFVEPERKKVADILEPWIPIR